MTSQQLPYWNMQIEPFLNTPEMKTLQLAKLKIKLEEIYNGALFHRKRMDAVKLTPDYIRKLKNIEEFSKIMPVYDKAGFREHAVACNGDLIKLMDEEMPISVDELTLINSTTGTTGEPTPYPLAYSDLDIYGECACRGAWRAGLRKDDRILFCFALSMVVAGTALVIAMQKTGATVIPVGAESGTDRIFQMAKYYKPTVYFGTPSLLSHMIEIAPSKIGMDVKSLGMRKLLCGGEAGAGIPEIKSKLTQAYNAEIYDTGAGYGWSCNHEEYQGMHWLGDDFCIYELVDPDTREPIPLEDGARGEAVFTHIEGGGWSWLRTSLGDIHEVTVSPCPCGQSGFRYKVVGRTDDMLKVKGVIVYPAAVSSLLETFVPKVTGEFRIVLTEKPPLVFPPLKIKIEKGVDYPNEKLSELENELLEAFHTKMKIRPNIIWQKPGELDRSTYKGKKFEVLYKK